MKIAIAGGLGFEEDLIRALGGHSVYLIGSGFDLKKEKFVFPSGAEFTGEYLTHNYRESLSERDILIDVSENLKSKFILNDASVLYKKKFLSVVFSGGWKLAVIDPVSGGGCLQCAVPYSKPLPSFTLPAHPVDKIIEAIIRSMNGSGSYLLDLENNEKQEIGIRPDCDDTKGNYRFLNGEMADVSAVSCSDHSVAVTPMNELALDLSEYRSMLEKRARVQKQSPYFLQFKIGKFDCTLFRLGRMVIKGTKEKNTALYIYRNFIGS